MVNTGILTLPFHKELCIHHNNFNSNLILINLAFLCIHLIPIFILNNINKFHHHITSHSNTNNSILRNINQTHHRSLFALECQCLHLLGTLLWHPEKTYPI
mmetsp:Transcript_13840/g.20724  ORF Transcript_13840/g.20724 Transcript_13840/m.20724 type:complete len:101 (+) Transcript_13840:766-1068(+)